MFAFLFSVAVVVGVHYTFASTSYPDENPALQEYQNEAAAFPLEEQWYMMYRNYESDPFFGDKAKCVSITETKPGENGAYPVVLRYNPDVSIDLTATFSSSPGYTVKNIVIHHNQDQNVTIASRTAYKDVKKCDVLRMPQADWYAKQPEQRFQKSAQAPPSRRVRCEKGIVTHYRGILTFPRFPEA
ncbi:uncharacterized protein ISCGN_014856 [Ixodes scapularis]